MSLAPKEELEGETDPEALPPEERGAGPIGFLIVAVLAVSLVFGFVRPFVAEPFGITTDSMDPTLRAGDSVLAAKFVYRLAEPGRGDVSSSGPPATAPRPSSVSSASPATRSPSGTACSS